MEPSGEPTANHPGAREHPSAEILAAFAQGRLAGERAAEVEAHLEGCPRCGDLLDGAPVDEIQARLRAGPVTPTTQALAADGLPPPGPLPSVPGYEVLRELGHGGMGVVYLARQLSLSRLVALKMLRADCVDLEARLRFRAEADLLARLRHPNVVQVYEAGVHAGRRYLVLEYVAGGSLADRLQGARRGAGGLPFTPAQAADLVRTLAKAIHHAHSQGIVHRDLKPANVLLQEDLTQRRKDAKEDHKEEEPGNSSLLFLGGLASLRETSVTPKITDFGVAKLLEADPQTEHTLVAGTPGYLAPEQAAGLVSLIGPPTDVYGLGAILYELLTGRPPFLGATPTATVYQALREEPVPPRRLQRDVPLDLDTICLKSLSREAGHRYESAADLAADLGRFLRHEPIRARRTPPWEVARRWARRHPLPAALLGLLLAVTVTGLTVVLLQWRQAVTLANGEASARAEAERQLEETRRALYLDQVGRVEHEWRDRNTRKARALLDGCRPELRDWEWRWLRRQVEGGARTLQAEGPPVHAVAFAPDGRLAAADVEGRVRVWDAAGAPALAVSGSPSPLLAARWSPDGRLLATGAFDGSVRLRRGPALDQEVVLAGHARDASVLAFSPDGRRLASASTDGSLCTWDVMAGKLLRGGNPAGFAATELDFGPRGDLLAAAGSDGTLRVLDADTLAVRHQAVFPGESLFAARFLADGDRILVGRVDVAKQRTTVTLWSLSAGREAVSWDAGFYPAANLSLDAGGREVALPRYDGAVSLRDVATGRELRQLGGHAGRVWQAAHARDGSRLATAGEDGRVQLWDAADSPPQQHLEGGSVLAFSSEGEALATADRAGGVTVLTGERLDQARAGPPIPKPATALAWGGARWLAVLDESGRVTTWDAAAGQVAQVRDGQDGYGAALAFEPHGRWLASARPGGPIAVWDPATGQDRVVLRHRTRVVRGLAFRPDGEQLASVDEEGNLVLWDLATGQAVARRPLRAEGGEEGSEQGVAVAYRGDGRALAVVTRGRAVVLDAAAGREVFSFPVRQPGKQAAFNPAGTRLAVGDEDGVTLWDLGLGQPALNLRPEGPPTWAVAFSADGRRLAAAADVGGVTVWDAGR
jgi:serine/threonine protein kinase/WD40 repeat protein